MTGLLGVCGLVIDVGNLYEQHHQTQAAADAATGAGADAIPSGSCQSAARMYAAKNDEQGDQVSVSYNATDSVTVTVTRQAPTSPSCSASPLPRSSPRPPQPSRRSPR